MRSLDDKTFNRAMLVRKGHSGQADIVQDASDDRAVVARIVQLRQEKGLSQSALARQLGLTPQAIQRWEAGWGEPRGERLNDIARALGTTRLFLLTGDIRYRDVVKDISPEEPTNRVAAQALVEGQDLVWVPRCDFKLSAGVGLEQWDICDDVAGFPFLKSWFSLRRIDPANCRALQVQGRSMEPLLADGDTVLIDTNQTRIVDGDIYAVSLGNEFYIKILERIGSESVLLKSANADFSTITLNGDQLSLLTILGRKIWRGGEG